MPETPYCPLLSINKDVPVLCQEELCMWYVKQLNLCALTVQAYASAINIEVKPQAKPKQAESVKQTLNKEKPTKSINPFSGDDLD